MSIVCLQGLCRSVCFTTLLIAQPLVVFMWSLHAAHSEPNTAGRSCSALNRIVLAAKGDSANAKSQMWEAKCFPNWANQIRTGECRSQSPVPYRLAIALKIWRIFPALFCAARKCLISPLGTFLCLPREKAICTESTTLLHVSSMVSTISIATLASYRVSHSSFFVLLQVLQSQIQETALLSLSLE